MPAWEFDGLPSFGITTVTEAVLTGLRDILGRFCLARRAKTLNWTRFSIVEIIRPPAMFFGRRIVVLFV